MALSLVEMIVYGAIGYSTVIMVISLMVRNQFPDSSIHSIMRIVFVMPGMTCIVIMGLAMGSTEGEISGGNEPGQTALYDTRVPEGNMLHVLRPPTSGEGLSQIFISEKWTGEMVWGFNNVNGTWERSNTNTVQTVNVERDIVNLQGPVTWMYVHIGLFTILFVWVLYQFALMFTGLFKKQ